MLDLQALRQVGSPSYVAPEVLQSVPHYSSACDVWSLGVIVYVMLSGIPPFFGKTDEIMFRRIRTGKYRFYEEYWSLVSQDARDFVSKVLVVDPAKRATIADLLRHPWLVANQSDVHLASAMTKLKTFNAKRKLRVRAAPCCAQTESRRSTLVGGLRWTRGPRVNNAVRVARAGRSYGHRRRCSLRQFA